MNVHCPACGREVKLSALGAVNSAGEPVMEWHYTVVGRHPVEQPVCKGSYKSVAQVKREEKS